MRVGRASRTAEFNASLRAFESTRKPSTRLIDDPFAIYLLPKGLAALVRIAAVPVVGKAVVNFVDRRWPGMRSSVVARTFLIDEWLSEATGEGIDQMVLLGAGFDTRAWRLPFLARTRVFEVDYPATSATKQNRLRRLHSDLQHVRFVPVDFNLGTAAGPLLKAGFDPSRPALVLWDGVTNYLQPDAVDATMRWVGGLARGGQLVFTYIDAGVLDGTIHFDGAAAVMRTVNHSGEPWIFGLEPRLVPAYLRERGLRMMNDLGANDYRLHAMGPQARRIKGYAFYHAARAEIVGP
jgi:methyltransferase (TIGR00027 family)